MTFIIIVGGRWDASVLPLFLTNHIRKLDNMSQYFSKWENEWVDFSDSFGNPYNPNEIEIKEMLKYKYKLR